MNTKKGFTLVELLVVIAILAILATVSVVGYTSFIERAEESNIATELHQIETTINSYDISNQTYVIGTVTDKTQNPEIVTEYYAEVTDFGVEIYYWTIEKDDQGKDVDVKKYISTLPTDFVFVDFEEVKTSDDGKANFAFKTVKDDDNKDHHILTYRTKVVLGK